MPAHENWKKIRSKGDHLSNVEIEKIRDAFEIESPAREIARQLKCSTRTITGWYNKFRNVGTSLEKRALRDNSGQSAEVVKLCFVSECENEAKPDSNFCDKHAYQPPAFVRRLTGARA